MSTSVMRHRPPLARRDELLHESERDFQRAIVQLAQVAGWRVYHTWNSRHSPAGFPDLCLVRSGRLVFAELKSARGRVTLAQRAWLAALTTTAAAEVYLWRPADWPEIERTLVRREVRD